MSQSSGIRRQLIECTHGYSSRAKDAYEASITCVSCIESICTHHQNLQSIDCNKSECGDICKTCDRCSQCECRFTCSNHTVKFKLPTVLVKPHKDLHSSILIERILYLEGHSDADKIRHRRRELHICTQDQLVRIVLNCEMLT